MISRWKEKENLKRDGIVVWENQKCMSQGSSGRKVFKEKVSCHQMLQGYQSELSTLDSARSLGIFRSNIKHKSYGAVTAMQLKKGGWWCGNQCELNKSGPGHDLHESSASVAGTACLFENLCLSICDRVLVNWNAFDLKSNWVTQLPYIFNSLRHLVAFLVHQNIDWNN